MIIHFLKLIFKNKKIHPITYLIGRNKINKVHSEELTLT